MDHDREATDEEIIADLEAGIEFANEKIAETLRGVSIDDLYDVFDGIVMLPKEKFMESVDTIEKQFVCHMATSKAIAEILLDRMRRHIAAKNN